MKTITKHTITNMNQSKTIPIPIPIPYSSSLGFSASTSHRLSLPLTIASSSPRLLLPAYSRARLLLPAYSLPKLLPAYSRARLLLPAYSLPKLLPSAYLRPVTSAYSLRQHIPSNWDVRSFCTHYDFNFDHKIPIYSLKQMIEMKKLEYDYPIYWTKSLELMDEMKDFKMFEGTVPLSRTNKKNKHIIEVINRFNKVFSLILKNENSPIYERHLNFCKNRIELDCLMVTKMLANYNKRFQYYQKVFMRFERDLFCLNTFDKMTFDFQIEKFQSFCDDLRIFNQRKNELLKVISNDYREYCAALL